MEAARGRAKLGPAPAALLGRRGCLGPEGPKARAASIKRLNNKVLSAFGAMRQRRTKAQGPALGKQRFPKAGP